jgi:alpha/beta superfamily hydrolase
VAVVAHPHPLFGGTMDNKVVQTLARAFVQRLDSRGVLISGRWRVGGEHAEGLGETQDLLRAVEQVAPDGPLALAGFSFGVVCRQPCLGSFVGSTAALKRWCLLALATSRLRLLMCPCPRTSGPWSCTGEQDHTVPLSSVMGLGSAAGALPVMVVPGGGHFLHGTIATSRSLVVRRLSA